MIKVVDLFAGCGGLAEGFAQFRCGAEMPYRISLSAERDKHAIESLKLRAFVRLCRERGRLPNGYFEFLRGAPNVFHTDRDRSLWNEAAREALQVDLGTPHGGETLASAISSEVGPEEGWILIGGPPCQAFSLVGRSRNRGIATYRPENDARYFLYRAYLGALTRSNPPLAFVLENVKGMKSAHVDGQHVFSGILRDLSDPGRALNGKSQFRYRIYSLVTSEVCFRAGDDASAVDPEDFVVRSELYGVPQARHRVILVGIREDLVGRPKLLAPSAAGLVSVEAVIGDLPFVRSSSSDRQQLDVGRALINEFVAAEKRGLRRETDPTQWQQMREVLGEARHVHVPFSGLPFISLVNEDTFSAQVPPVLRKWLVAPRLNGVVDHQARPHMPADLIRYLFCTTYSNSFGRSPTSKRFPEALAPNHKSWKSGSFADRFRVQLGNRPATTITSHISKDGHYFIHPDAEQLRSLTVREAARLQTFPDDYYFVGPRTAKYLQVGNAVPPFLAHQIAAAIHSVLM